MSSSKTEPPRRQSPKKQPSPLAAKPPPPSPRRTRAVIALLAVLLVGLVGTAALLHSRTEGGRAGAHAPPPPEVRVAGPPPSPAKAPATGGPWTCLTLEAYSDRFVASERQRQQGKRFFRCGTRLTDLATERQEDLVAACAPAAAAGSASAWPTLRVVLTPQEVGWHTDQRLNLGVGVVPLTQLNDDYCDCLDGTDELQTGACSMAGPGMPLGLARWRQYVTANRDVPLYQDTLEDEPRKGGSGAGSGGPKVAPTSAHERPRVKASTWQGDAIGGPVLPFACKNDPEMWLSPTMVGDGIVDCCDGSDESPEAWVAVHGSTMAAALPTGSDGLVAQTLPAAMESVRAAALSAWERRRGAQDDSVTAATGAYADPVHPYYTSAAAVLVDKGYTSLFSCAVVHKHRLASSEAMLDLTRAGHAILRQREADGWEMLGRAMVDNLTHLATQLGNATRERDALKRKFTYMMEVRQTDDPAAAGIEVADAERYHELTRTLQVLQQELDYLRLVSTQTVFGEHYEYYPLFARELILPAKRVTTTFDSRTARVRRRRRALHVPFGDVATRPQLIAHHEAYAAAVEARGEPRPAPPPALHVDNISEDAMVIIPGRVALVSQRARTREDQEAFVRMRGLLNPDEPFSAAAFQNHPDPFVLSQGLLLGHWQPFRVDANASVMAVLDPAGDVDLPRRFSIRPFTALTRGGGRLQTPTRRLERRRAMTFKDTSKGDKRKGSGAGGAGADNNDDDAAKDEFSIPILYHRNTANTLATHNFEGGSLRCGLAEDASTGTKWTSLRAAFGCAAADGILAWARNGKCQHEVLIGTPSACTRWVLREVEDRVERHRRLVHGVDHRATDAPASRAG